MLSGREALSSPGFDPLKACPVQSLLLMSDIRVGDHRRAVHEEEQGEEAVAGDGGGDGNNGNSLTLFGRATRTECFYEAKCLKCLDCKYNRKSYSGRNKSVFI